MNDQINVLKDDIAFMRALAQEGRTPPLLGGAVLAGAGVIYSVASLVCWAMAARLIEAPAFWFWGVWVVAMMVQWGVMAALRHYWRRGAKPGALAPANRAFRWAWAGCGYAIITIFLGTLLAAQRFHSPLVFATFPTIVFAIYGAAWTVSAVMSGGVWMRWVAGGCFVAAIGLAASPSPADTYLAFAACLLLLMAAPGAALMRQEPTEIV